MNFPSADLRRLKGRLKGAWSVKVSGNWRIIFHCKEGHASEVDYVDYR